MAIEIMAAHRLCLNDAIVPTTIETLTPMDPYNLEPEASDFPGEIGVTLVSFQTTSMAWIHKGLQIDRRWWHQNCDQIPLLKEVLELINAKKIKRGAGKHLPRNCRASVILELRGKILKFKNNARVVILVVTSIDDFQWFMEQIGQDINDMQLAQPADNDEDPEDPEDSQEEKDDEEKPGDDQLDSCVIETIGKILEHENCKSVHFSHPRTCFRVKRKNTEVLREFRVKDLKKKRALALKNKDKSVLLDAFVFAQTCSMKFLSEPASELAGLAAPAGSSA